MKRSILATIISALLFVLGVGVGYYYAQPSTGPLLSPFVDSRIEDTYTDYSLYSIEDLKKYEYETSKIHIDEVLSKEPEFTQYSFHYTTRGRHMSGTLNVPTGTKQGIVLMMRGYVPDTIYSPGVGTKNAAAYYARSGLVTIAPDFFGYGSSDPEPEDTWIARFEKPITVIELYKSLQESDFSSITEGDTLDTTSQPLPIGFWGHSNGGQIALSVLEILSEPIPTTLWAPVTAPFPYSILHFSDEAEDEGRSMRLWVNQLEKHHDLRDFSITSHLRYMAGPFILHHGTADEAAPKIWSDEFVQKVENENVRREELRKSPTLPEELPLGNEIEFRYYEYLGADHNLQPNWDKVVERDVVFFKESFASVR